MSRFYKGHPIVTESGAGRRFYKLVTIGEEFAEVTSAAVTTASAGVIAGGIALAGTTVWGIYAGSKFKMDLHADDVIDRKKTNTTSDHEATSTVQSPHDTVGHVNPEQEHNMNLRKRNQPASKSRRKRSKPSSLKSKFDAATDVPTEVPTRRRRARGYTKKYNDRYFLRRKRHIIEF